MNQKIDIIDCGYWFNAIRNLPDIEKAKALDAFWHSQLTSKYWIIDILNSYIKKPSSIYVFGGWIGVLPSLLFQASTFPITHITNIDIDPWCDDISKTICTPYLNKFSSITMDMANFDYNIIPNIVINTSCEHISQNTYDNWFSKIPNKTIIVLQSNNYFDCDQHIRCSNSLTNFKQMHHVNQRTIYEGVKKCEFYDRYMCIWMKH